MYEFKLNKILRLVENNKFIKAEQLFKKLLKNLIKLIKDYPNDMNIIFTYLDSLFKKRKFENIINIIDKKFFSSSDQNILRLKSVCFLEMEKPAQAVKELEKLIKNNFDPLNFNYMGIAYGKLKKYDLAKKYFLKSIDFQNNTNFIINYINFLRDSNQNKEAVSFIKQHDPEMSNYDLNIILIGILRDEKKHDEALKYCEKFNQINQEDINLLLIQAIIYSEIGKKKQCIETLEKIIQIQPFFGPAHRVMSLLNEKISRERLSDLEDHLAQAADNDLNSVHLGLAVSNYLENVNDFSNSFKYLKKYNSIYRSYLNFDFNSLEENFEKTKILYKSVLEKDLKIKEFKSTPIFILGMPRSSTSLIEQILSSHTQVEGLGELLYVEREINSFFDRYSDFVKQDFLLNELYYLKVDDLIKKKKYFTDKSPLNFLYIGLLSKIFPNAKIILCEKNRMDNLYSLYRNFFPMGVEFSYNLEELKKFSCFYDDVISFGEMRILLSIMLITKS